VHEPHSPSLDRDDLGIDRGPEAPPCAGIEGVQDGECGLGNRGYGEKRSASLGRKNSHAIGYELFQPWRNGKNLAG
jgi:hypothetical protein